MAKKTTDVDAKFDDVPLAHPVIKPAASKPEAKPEPTLVEKLAALTTGNPVLNHQAACDLLLQHIGDDAVTAAFNAIPRYM